MLTRAFIVPEPLQINTEQGLAPFEFLAFVRFFLDNSKPFVTNAKGLRAAVRIDEAVREAKDIGADGKVMLRCVLEEADWAQLREAVENPDNGYPLRPPRVQLPFIEAICNAE